MRKGFSMIFAIFFMLLLSTIIAVSLKNVNDNYKNVHSLKEYEKANLFMDNAIEMVVLGISQYDRSNDCAQSISVFNDDFNVSINIDRYLTEDGSCSGIIVEQESEGTLFLEVELIGKDIRLYRNVVRKI